MTESLDKDNRSGDDLVAVKQHNRTQLIVIMAIAYITLGASYAAYYYAQTTGAWSTTNNGSFVQPPVSAEQLGWQVEGDTRKWWLWVVSEECSTNCQATVKNMRALQILLNREADRVRRGFTSNSVSDQTWLENYPNLAQIEVADLTATKPGLYIVDPNGNLVFFYAMQTNPKLVLQDLKKLLKVSHIG